jgi:hypothetical protein
MSGVWFWFDKQNTPGTPFNLELIYMLQDYLVHVMISKCLSTYPLHHTVFKVFTTVWVAVTAVSI